MLEFIFQLIGEILLQFVLEGLAQLGLHSLAEPFRRPPNPWLAALGYALFGFLAGFISLFIVESHLLREKPFQLLNLLVTPVLVGLAMAQIGAWRARRGDAVLRIDRFAYAYLFALAFAIVRFYCAK
jgi:fluoride ion exporter CrcB/FEX